MKLIAGLGNPGKKYQNNRHNLGFMVVDSFLVSVGLSWRYNPDWMGFYAKSDDYVLFKPSTFMNKSGQAILAVSHFYKIKNNETLIVYDDLDLPFGKIRLSFDGLPAGHHGVESVIEGLGSMDFGRLRMGIGSPRSRFGEAGHPVDDSGSKSKDVTSYVLEDFTEKEKAACKKLFEKAEEAIKSYINEGLEATMNRFN